MRRILAIDDDVELCELLSAFFSGEGYDFHAVHDGPAGIHEALAGDYDAVILDVMLPGCNGFEVLREIRSKSRMPVLMLTAKGEHVDRIVGLEMGADDYVPKPFNTRELAARVRAVLRRTETSAADGAKAFDAIAATGDIKVALAEPGKFGFLLWGKFHDFGHGVTIQTSEKMRGKAVASRRNPIRFSPVKAARRRLRIGLLLKLDRRELPVPAIELGFIAKPLAIDLLPTQRVALADEVDRLHPTHAGFGHNGFELDLRDAQEHHASPSMRERRAFAASRRSSWLLPIPTV